MSFQDLLAKFQAIILLVSGAAIEFLFQTILPFLWKSLRKLWNRVSSRTDIRRAGKRFEKRYLDWFSGILPEPGVPVGATLETPGAILAVDRFLKTGTPVAFGLNDLMQALFGADRDLPAVHDQLDPYSPDLYRFLRLAAELAGPATGQVQLCGILPQLPGLLPVLLGLGYRTFSVDVAHAPYLARSVASRSVTEDQVLADAVCEAASGREVAGFLQVTYPGK